MDIGMKEIHGGVPVGYSPTRAKLDAIEGQNIVCFAKDWSEDPTSCNHVLHELSKKNKVVWLNSISTRAPKIHSGRDLSKIVRKLASFFKGPRHVREQMWVYTPIVLPFHHNRAAVMLNTQILRITLALLKWMLGIREFQLWTFVPTSAPYVGSLGANLLVYYCTDEWSAFSSVDGERIGAMVQSLSKRADVVFATSRPLVEKLQQNNPETHLAAHGVNYELFARAMQEDTPLPPDIAALQQPVLGFYGLIQDWLDLDLLAYLAERHPEWSIVLLGKVCVDTSRLARYPNIHFLGHKPHSELPNYCKAFSVGLIPHKVNKLTVHMNPIKLREYLCAGLPVVSTALPEVQHYSGECIAADGYEAFEHAVEAILKSETPERRRERSLAMRTETWESRVSLLCHHILRMQERKAGVL